MRACSVMVIIDASQALDPGSIPGRRSLADIAQLGERQTEDLKVPGSIPSVGNTALVAQFGRAWV